MALKKITDHFLVPRQEIVPSERVHEVLEKFGAELDNLPQVLRSDPAVEEIGAKPGDVIKITRESRTAGKAVYYRVVV